MKKLLLVLAICVTVAFGVQPHEIGNSTNGGSYNAEPTDDLIFAQTYINDDFTHGWAYGQECDDFELIGGAIIDKVVIWACTVDLAMSPMPPLDFCDFAFLQDDGSKDPNSATTVWKGTSTVTYIDTGDAFSGGTLPIYELTCTLSSPVNLTGGRYWLVVTQYYEDDDYRFYSCTHYVTIILEESWANNGEPPWETGESLWGDQANMFFDLYGTPLALDNSTWGNIKSVF